MSDWASYQFQDFVPFSADVYFRLLSRMGESFWPLQLATLIIGILAVIFALRGRARIALVLIAPVWGFVGMAFFAHRYSSLNWAGEMISWIWLFQCAVLLLLALSGWGMTVANVSQRNLSLATVLVPTVQVGVLIALFGLIGYPLLGLAMEQNLPRAEAFGLHPDPTAVVTLGILLIGLRGAGLWAAALVPILWLLVSALTLKALDAPWYPALLVIVVLTMTGGVASCRTRSSP